MKGTMVSLTALTSISDQEKIQKVIIYLVVLFSCEMK